MMQTWQMVVICGVWFFLVVEVVIQLLILRRYKYKVKVEEKLDKLFDIDFELSDKIRAIELEQISLYENMNNWAKSSNFNLNEIIELNRLINQQEQKIDKLVRADKLVINNYRKRNGIPMIRKH